MRYLSNYSTGVMGSELVRAAKARRHRVTWVDCSAQTLTARDLRTKLSKLAPRHDVLVMAAAVCDARPAAVSRRKIKKASLSAIRLVENPDVLAELALKKKKGQVFVGFGLESSDLEKNGRRKLKYKKLEAIVMQKVANGASPFGKALLDGMVLDRTGSKEVFHRASKRALARKIIRKAEEFLLD